jgi:hypothetical protein
MGLFSWVKSCGLAGRAELFLGQLANHNDQQHDYGNADHRPKPHPAAQPSTSSIRLFDSS